jgi:hypothetical protein
MVVSHRFHAILAQRCSNKHERFLIVEEHSGGRRRGHILVPEGRDGEGWSMFEAELHLVVNFFHLLFVDRLLMGVGKIQTTLCSLTWGGGRMQR